MRKNSMLFLDTEFTGLQQQTDLISLAMVADSGEEFYAEFTDYDKQKLNPWLTEHVLSKCWIIQNIPFEKKEGGVYISGNKTEVKRALQEWLLQFKTIEVWADVLAWDWVLFCELFGGAFSFPENIFYSPFDLATLFRMKGFIAPLYEEIEVKKKYELAGINENAMDIRKSFIDVKRFVFAGTDASWHHNALADARAELACYHKLMEPG